MQALGQLQVLADGGAQMGIRFWHRVKIECTGLSVCTRGLLSREQPELRIRVDSIELVKDAEAFLRFVLNYLDETGRRIRASETLGYGYWTVKFQQVRPDLLEVWEYDAEATELRPGGSLALRYWKEQHMICNANGADFSPPNPEDLTAVSKGVMEGAPVQATRYPLAEPMSGWIIVTDEYDGKVESLKTHHTYHITAKRPELAKYLALPPGFCMDLRTATKICFDQEAAEESI